MQIGSVVSLKICNRVMVVNKIVDPEYRVCVWVDDAGVPHEGNYHVTALELDDQEADFQAGGRV